ncbi:GDSL-type esterase/lipase family protein [Pseudactinotalea suaedae]|uniref:GDSL-type esterase/lipase family protein n=1 Tax=Pseudactinotalea suaedae TaxID=1524924 RepID=UPI00240E7120|nr:GDSL-type esterase/lipase family protein [Pseudactinotalea suaedae]
MSRRVAVVGDELAAGVGDPRGMGWVGRVIGRTTAPETLEVYTLAVPGETSTQLSARWETECNRRFGPGDNRLVVSLGSADLDHGISLARSRLNLANVLDDAANRRIPAFVVGPPPRPGVEESALAELSRAYSDVCQRRRVPYAETFEPLRAHEQWLADVAAGDGIHPGQAGYGLLAWLVLHNGWHDWIGADDPDAS